MTTPIVLKNFIGGKTHTIQNKEYIDSVNPATGKACTNLKYAIDPSVHAKIPRSSQEDVNQAVSAALAAFPAWSKTSRAERSKYLYTIANILESRMEEFAAAESRDQGKTITFARMVDIPRAVYNFRFFAENICQTEEKATMLDGLALNYVQRWPAGVAGLISPWNLPLYLLTWKIAPCIAAGCTCVCKPSEFTSVTAYMLCDVIKEAKLPDGVVNMVFGSGPEVGEALVNHPKVPLISFTGGTATGQKIIANSAKNFKKLSLELGGKNANVVFDDCNFDKAIEGSIRAAFSNQGEFLDAFVEKAKALIVGDPADSKTQVGALNSEQHMQKVLGYIELAKEEGGNIVCGGNKKVLEGELKDGYFVEPTVITGLPPSCRVAQEEIFGPVVTIHQFTTTDEAISFANDSQYGLSCSIWTENIRRARHVAESIQVGTVWVNCWMLRDLRMPFGGSKRSGLGREGADYSLDFYTESKTICLAN
ncbi:7059_t:CDS:10 [Paraglomus brasilianum]|uniref:7059_t:CDS:1 n=1 Tax=Paraglomus brasilianum TaxID=144538 RepID=A0A9N8YX83_9GLOM|nr:7059_t:CDS:10 [Paraglomus brasilianum]